ncbi:MAG TPA: hypothetical protein VLL52_09625 [Anaerolineae bacterium]|nr:hypothetical protein [Anaerolineae bacterium]
MPKKPYSPMAPYEQLQLAQTRIEQAETADDLRAIVKEMGSKIGYKAFCYMLMEKMTAEGMKPDDAVLAAQALEAEGDVEGAKRIYDRVKAAHPDHPLTAEEN